MELWRGPDGTSSSRRAGAVIFAAAPSKLDPAHAQAALQEEHWRRSSPRYFRQPGLDALACLDGERHVRASMDMVIDAACKANTRTSVAFLATPTDVSAVTRETAKVAMAVYAHPAMASKTFQGSLHLAAGDRFYHPNVERLLVSDNGLEYGVVDSPVFEQGLNDALARRLQQWRAAGAQTRPRGLVATARQCTFGQRSPDACHDRMA